MRVQKSDEPAEVLRLQLLQASEPLYFSEIAAKRGEVNVKVDPDFEVMPRYWVTESEVEGRLEGSSDEGWLMGFRDICRNTDERTVIAGGIPRAGVGHTLPLILCPNAARPMLPVLV